MASDTDVNMKVSCDINVDNYRAMVQNYINLHLYQSALFWADKVVAISCGNPKDVYWLAQCMFHMKQYHRAAHLLRSQNLDSKYVLCNYLTAHCLFEANELKDALETLNKMELEVQMQSNADNDGSLFDDTPIHQIKASMFLLKGKILEMMDNRGLAADCFKEALACDVYCYEAFEALVKHHMLSAAEEQEILSNLPLSEQCNESEAEIIKTLYNCKRKKYHIPSEAKPKLKDLLKCSGTPREDESTSKPDGESVGDVSSVLERLEGSLDFVTSEAEKYYYNCDYQRCSALTEVILKQDPYHSDCLPIHIACQVELKQSNKLFSLAHTLVDLHPNLAISWFAVGCYYYVIGKSDSARRYLAKATCLDRLFGPAWLAYGHSFAAENEHDQAMAAYFKSSQLMKGCHLPLLYIGLECGLTNNVKLSLKYFQQALKIAPQDPFIMHEMGVVAFNNLEYKSAEKYFKQALDQVKKIQDSTLPQRWEPLLSNLGHTARKLKKYKEALEFHEQALTLSPQSPGTYSAIAYVHTLMGNTVEAVDWFHKALALKRDDAFSLTMLNYVLQQLVEEQPPYDGAPEGVPEYKTLERHESKAESDLEISDVGKEPASSAMSMSIEEFDVSDALSVVKES